MATKHGLCKHPIYSRWEGINQRCNNKNAKAFRFYGARGIKVCSEWSEFKNFFDWSISNGFKKHLEIDRIDSNGNYEPSNCRWVEKIVNIRNVAKRHRDKPFDWGIRKIPSGGYHVQIRHNINGVSRLFHYGTYKLKSEAIKVRDKAEKKEIDPVKVRPDKGLYLKPWGIVVHVVKNKKCYHVGTFKTKKEAIIARDKFYNSLQ